MVCPFFVFYLCQSGSAIVLSHIQILDFQCVVHFNDDSAQPAFQVVMVVYLNFGSINLEECVNLHTEEQTSRPEFSQPKSLH